LSGFGANQTVSFAWFNDAATSAPLATTPPSITTDANGHATATFSVPDGHMGAHTIKAMSATTSGTVSFNIQPTFVLSATSGKPGDVVTATFTGYGTDSISLSWYATASNPTPLGMVGPDAIGRATMQFTVPASAAPGNYSVAASSTGLAAQAKPFAVQSATGPLCSLTPVAGVPGNATQLHCSNFRMQERVKVCWDGTTNCPWSFIADGGGIGTVSFAVPDGSTGAHTITAIGLVSATQSALTFTITPNVLINNVKASSPGTISVLPGASVTV